MSADREPLAALVARCRKLLPIVRGPSASVRLRTSDADRLLAAVEAGTKCADALRTEALAGVECPSCGRDLRSLSDGGPSDGGTHSEGCVINAALAEWDGHR